MIENENKSFTDIFFFFSEIMIPKHGVIDHGLKKEIKVLVKTFFCFPSQYLTLGSF